MAEGTTTIGVGEALRRVRTARGLSVAEAARDTRIRTEFLEAIEDDAFDRLLGDVHARGCLRTYASYLRVSPDRVVEAYAATRPEPAEPPNPTVPPQTAPALGAPRRRDNHRLLIMVAATVLVLAGAFGVLSARQPAPPPAELPSEAPPVATSSGAGITVTVLAREPVEITVAVDGGAAEPFALEVGEGRSFHGRGAVTLGLSEGGTAEVTVNGRDEGFPGAPDQPWKKTYRYGVASPSPAG